MADQRARDFTGSSGAFSDTDRNPPPGVTADDGVDPTLVGASSSRTGSDSYNIGAAVGVTPDMTRLLAHEPEEGNDEAIEDAAGGFGDTVGATSGETVGGNVVTNSKGGASHPVIEEG